MLWSLGRATGRPDSPRGPLQPCGSMAAIPSVLAGSTALFLHAWIHGTGESITRSCSDLGSFKKDCVSLSRGCASNPLSRMSELLRGSFVFSIVFPKTALAPLVLG